jgi:RNA polymerase sigma-70 factor (ECF subfamily)
MEIGRKYHYGQSESTAPVPEHIQIAFLNSLHVTDLALAQACAAGHASAWERLLHLYRETVQRTACAITREESSGGELADSIYAWLYGMKEQNGVRLSPLASYTGRGALTGWLRTVLTQRFIDAYHRNRRETSLDEMEEAQPVAAAEPAPATDQNQIATVTRAAANVLSALHAEDGFLLASYYLDRRTLQQIAQLLSVHESTISRRLTRLTHNLRKQLLRQLQSAGLSRRAAEEALGIDVRDVDIDIRKILQLPATAAFLGHQAKGGISRE